jgi:hypothetical protein
MLDRQIAHAGDLAGTERDEMNSSHMLCRALIWRRLKVKRSDRSASCPTGTRMSQTDRATVSMWVRCLPQLAVLVLGTSFSVRAGHGIEGANPTEERLQTLRTGNVRLVVADLRPTETISYPFSSNAFLTADSGTSHCLSIWTRAATLLQSLPCSTRRVWISEIRVSASRSASTLV